MSTCASPSEQLAALKIAEDSPLAAGDINYIIDYKWWLLLREHIGWSTSLSSESTTTDEKTTSEATPAPPAISNAGLLQFQKDGQFALHSLCFMSTFVQLCVVTDEPTLKKKLAESSDYAIGL
jgi:hypothetical protein